MLNHHEKLLFIALAIVLLISCKDASKKTYSLNDVAITAEGPLFDGPNTMQATHAINLNDIVGGLLLEQIESVKLTKAELITEDSIAFNNIRNFVLQFTAADAPMQKAGVLNPVPKNSSTIQISPAAEAELKKER